MCVALLRLFAKLPRPEDSEVYGQMEIQSINDKLKNRKIMCLATVINLIP